MSFIIHRKTKNATYIYIVTSYRNKQGKPRNHQKCLGKLNNDGVLISTKKRLPSQIKEVVTITKKFILEPAGTLKQSRRTPGQSQSRTARPSPSVHAPSVQPQESHHAQGVRPSPAQLAEPHTTRNNTADQQTQRQRSCPASSATTQRAELQAQAQANHLRICASLPHEPSRSPRKRSYLLRAVMPQARRARFRRKGRGTLRPQPSRQVC